LPWRSSKSHRAPAAKLDALFLDEGFGNRVAASLDEALTKLSEHLPSSPQVSPAAPLGARTGDEPASLPHKRRWHELAAALRRLGERFTAVVEANRLSRGTSSSSTMIGDAWAHRVRFTCGLPGVTARGTVAIRCIDTTSLCKFAVGLGARMKPVATRTQIYLDETQRKALAANPLHFS
jgi:hypothetical protein